MDRFFDSDNPLMKFLSRVVDLAVLNLMTVACMIPVVTAGASLTAMNNVLIHLVRKDETYVWKMFLKSFRQNLKQGIGLGLIFMLLAAFVAGDLLILHAIDSKASTVLMIMITVVSACILVVGVYAFALMARYENSIKGTLINAVKLAISHVPRSLVMIVIWVLLAVGLWFIRGIAMLAFVIYGLSLPGLLCTLLYDPIFRKMEKEEQDGSEQDRES